MVTPLPHTSSRTDVRTLADAPQAAVAKKAPAKKPLATKKNAPNDSISEDESAGESSPLKVPNAMEDGDENAAGPSKPAKAPKDASEMYQKVCMLIFH